MMDEKIIYDLQKELNDLKYQLPLLVRSAVTEAVSKLQAENSSPLMTRQQVAAYLHIDLSTLYRWDTKSFLKPVRIAGRCLYRREDIDKAFSKSEFKKAKTAFARDNRKK